MNTYKLTLLAILAALAVVGRYAFSFLPNVQPVTSIIIVCGLFLGPIAAVLLALLVTFLSNMMLGMGIWTIWQVISWAVIGLISGIIGKTCKRIPLYVIVLFSIFSGYFYGLIISATNYTISGKFIPYYLAGLPFDTYHAIGNAAFIILLYPALSRVFHTYVQKYKIPEN